MVMGKCITTHHLAAKKPADEMLGETKRPSVWRLTAGRRAFIMSISVIIPVKNGASTLERCLKSICNQSRKPDEIIVIDSASQDNSRQIALQFGAKVIDIRPEEFDHGLTRNLGVQRATSNLVYLTVQDAWIDDDSLFQRMAAHFDDPEVMAVTGHQAVPHEKDKNPVRWYHRYSDYNTEVRQLTSGVHLKGVSQREQMKLISWDNVVAMYRRDALLQLPFVQTEMSEDWMWSYQALERGWKLLRDSSLVVYHYHHHTYAYTFNTTYSVNYHFQKFFGFRPELPPVIKPFIQAVYHLFRNKELSLREKIYWSGHNLLAGIGAWSSDFNFLWRMKLSGQKGIEKGYRKYCKKIPQGRQKGRG